MHVKSVSCRRKLSDARRADGECGRTDIGDAVEWQRRERASWTRPWDSDYEEVRAEFPDLFDEQDDREHEIHKAWATEHGIELGEAYPDLAAARATSGKASAQPKKKKAGK